MYSTYVVHGWRSYQMKEVNDEMNGLTWLATARSYLYITVSHVQSSKAVT